MKVSGGCACGRITYQIDGSLLSHCWCYCITCQICSGGPFIPFACFKQSSISWNQNPDVWESSEFARRYFCNHCGSTIGMYYMFDQNSIAVARATITSSDETLPGTTHHIFLQDKPSWFSVPNDGALRCDRFPDDFEDRINDFIKKHEGKSDET